MVASRVKPLSVFAGRGIAGMQINGGEEIDPTTHHHPLPARSRWIDHVLLLVAGRAAPGDVGGETGMSHKRKSEIVTPKDNWGTPRWLFDLLNQEFHFNVDAASREYNTQKCNRCFTDALELDWVKFGERFWLNPPYSAGNIDKFMAKAYEESQKGAVVVCLVPCATDTRWWHNYAMKAQEIRFIKGRVRFVGYDEHGEQIKNSPNFSSCVVIFDQKLWQGNPYPWIGKSIEQPKEGKVPA